MLDILTGERFDQWENKQMGRQNDKREYKKAR